VFIYVFPQAVHISSLEFPYVVMRYAMRYYNILVLATLSGVTDTTLAMQEEPPLFCVIFFLGSSRPR
jgi:hypothetical protein